MDEVVGLLCAQARRFGTTELDALAIDRAQRIPVVLRGRIAELGLFGVTIPEAHGGLGLGLAEACAVVAELGRFDRSVAVTVGLHLGLGTRALVELGADTLRAAWLPRLAAGEHIAAFCATEPGAGSDLTRIRTTAALVDGEAGSGELRIDGEKSYVTNGGFAGCFTVLARTPGLGGARATSLLFIPRDLPGVTVGPEEHKLGIRGSSTVTVRFDDVRVPLDHLLGAPGDGLDAAHRSLEWGRTIMSAGCVGTARAALDLTLAQTTTRRQFGKMLVELGGVEEHVAWMAARLFAMEALVERVGELEARREDIATASVIAKVFTSEGAFEVCDRALQLHGALGFIEDTGVALLLRDCRVTRIFEGTNDVLALHLGASVVARPDKHTAPLHSPDDTPTSRAWERVASRLAAEAQLLRRAHGVTLLRHPRLVSRIGRAAIALAAATAALRRAERDGQTERALGERAAVTLIREADTTLHTIAHAEDDASLEQRVVSALTRERGASENDHKQDMRHRQVAR